MPNGRDPELLALRELLLNVRGIEGYQWLLDNAPGKCKQGINFRTYYELRELLLGGAVKTFVQCAQAYGFMG